MKTLVLSFLLVFSLLSCEPKSVSAQTEVCNVKDPIRNLPWLHDLVEKAISDKEANILTIKLFEFKGRPILNYYTSYMSCYGCINYECDGSRVDMSELSEQDLEEFRAMINDVSGKNSILWPKK